MQSFPCRLRDRQQRKGTSSLLNDKSGLQPRLSTRARSKRRSKVECLLRVVSSAWHLEILHCESFNYPAIALAKRGQVPAHVALQNSTADTRTPTVRCWEQTSNERDHIHVSIPQMVNAQRFVVSGCFPVCPAA